MAAMSEFPSMGATIFVGLTGVALITQGPAPEELANPLEIHGDSGFETGPDHVMFAGFLSWSAPLLLEDTDLAGTNGPDHKPQPGAPLVQFADLPTAHARVDVKSHVAAALRVPVSMNTDFAFELSASSSGTDAPVRLKLEARDSAFEQSTRVSEKTAQWAVFAKDAPSMQKQPKETVSANIQRTHKAVRPVSQTSQKPVRTQPDRAAGSLRVAIPVQVTGNAVYLRTAPSRSADPVTKFDAGANGLVLEIKGDWRLVAFDAVTGWMFGAFLDPLGQ